LVNCVEIAKLLSIVKFGSKLDKLKLNSKFRVTGLNEQKAS